MRIASYDYKDQISWGIVVKHPRRNNEDWIFNPGKAEKSFGAIANAT